MRSRTILIVSLVILILSIVAGYFSQIFGNRQNYVAESSRGAVGKNAFCKVSFTAGFPFVFYQTDQHYEGPAGAWINTCTEKVSLQEVNLRLFVLDVIITSLPIFLLTELLFVLIFGMLKLDVSMKRLLVSIFLASIWTVFSFGLFLGIGMGGGSLPTWFIFTVILPLGLSLFTSRILGAPYFVGSHNFFAIVLPFIIALILIYVFISLVGYHNKEGRNNVLHPKA